MRGFLCFLLACVLWAPAWAKPQSAGVFTDRDGVRHAWHVNEAHTLIWDGKPYLPVGGMYCAPYTWEQTEDGWKLTQAQLDLLKRKGVIDVYVHFAMSAPPECLQRILDYLDRQGFRYGIELTDGPGSGPGYAVQKEGMKVERITASGTYSVEAPDAVGGVYVVADEETGRVLKWGNAMVYEREEPTGKTLESGQPETAKKKGLEAKVECRPGRKLSLYFTPLINGGQPYFWDGGYDRYRTKLLDFFGKVRFGKGFRFVVDPLHNEMNVSHTFLPSSPEYARQFSAWLSARYGSVENLNRAWAMAIPLTDFDTAARLVPIRTIRSPAVDRQAQIGVLLDPAGNKVCTADARRSQVWYDMMDFQAERVSKYCNAVCTAFKRRVADVPIVFKHAGPIAGYRINHELAGFDGIGMEPYGVGETLLPMNAAVCYSEVEQSARTMWLLVTEFSQAAFDFQLENIGHMDRRSMYADMSALLGAGAKGIFVFGLSFGPGAGGQFWMSEYVRDPRQLEWISTFRRIMENSPRLPDYRPTVYYRFPAQRTEQSAFGPLERDYTGVDGDWTGCTGSASRSVMRGPDGTWVLPTWSASVDTPLIIANLSGPPASLRYGPALEEVVKEDKALVTYVGFRRDPGSIPSVDRYFTDRYAKDADGRTVQVLKPTADSKVLARTPEGHVWNLTDGRLQIISKEVEDRQGWQPEGLRIPAVDQVHEPERFLAEVLGVREFRVDPDILGFTFLDGGRPVTCLWSEEMASTVRLSHETSKSVEVRYANGEPAGELAADGSLVMRIPLKQRPEMTEDAVPYVRGKHYPTEKWQDALVLAGMPIEKLMKPEDLLPVYPRPDLAPGVWVEAEEFTDSNFNLGKYSGMTRLSGGAFWGLDTFVAPSPDIGYYVSYSFKCPEAGQFDFWVREWVGKSPCFWRVNGGKWNSAPETLEDHQTEFCGPWACFDDGKIIFAWHNYGTAMLRKGDNTLDIRLIAKRKKGDKYCKFLDALAFTLPGKKPWE